MEGVKRWCTHIHATTFKHTLPVLCLITGSYSCHAVAVCSCASVFVHCHSHTHTHTHPHTPPQTDRLCRAMHRYFRVRESGSYCVESPQKYIHISSLPPPPHTHT